MRLLNHRYTHNKWAYGAPCLVYESLDRSSSTQPCRTFDDFVQQLDDVELTQGYFHQDSVTCHTPNVLSVELTESFFPNRVISEGLWPPKSSDLTSPNFFLWGLLKDRVYANKPHTSQDLKDNILAEMRNITGETLCRVTANMQTRAEACLLENSGHFQCLL
jgi:hypothetical protein